MQPSISLLHPTYKKAKTMTLNFSTITPETPAQRVAVARDVIEQIDRYARLRSMAYIIAPEAIFEPYPTGASLQAAVHDLIPQCEVCLKGALVLSHIKLLDGFTAVPKAYQMHDVSRHIWGGELADRLERVYMGHPTPATFRSLMQNVIDNDGDFVWSTEDDSL